MQAREADEEESSRIPGDTAFLPPIHSLLSHPPGCTTHLAITLTWPSHSLAFSPT